jgi:hypothetical protein
LFVAAAPLGLDFSPVFAFSFSSSSAAIHHHTFDRVLGYLSR